MTIAVLLFTAEDDGWLTESCIYEFTPHIRISLSPVSLLYRVSALTHLTCTEHSLSMSAPSLQRGAEDELCCKGEPRMGRWVALASGLSIR